MKQGIPAGYLGVAATTAVVWLAGRGRFKRVVRESKTVRRSELNGGQGPRSAHAVPHCPTAPAAIMYPTFAINCPTQPSTPPSAFPSPATTLSPPVLAAPAAAVALALFGSVLVALTPTLPLADARLSVPFAPIDVVDVALSETLVESIVLVLDVLVSVGVGVDVLLSVVGAGSLHVEVGLGSGAGWAEPSSHPHTS